MPQSEKVRTRLHLIDERLARLRAEKERLISRASKAERRRDTRRKIVIGGTILAAVEHEGVPTLWTRAELMRWLDPHQPPRKGEGLRIGATRRPPRGIPRARWQQDQYFDVWLPVVAPSAALLRRTKGDFERPDRRRRFFEAYARELEKTPARQTIDLLAALALRTRISIGCFCADESRCHRSVLRRVVESRARKLTRHAN